MIWPIFKATLRERSSSRVRVATLAAVAILLAFARITSGALGGAWTAQWYALAVGASAVSSEAASGALALVLARPVRRSDVVFGKFLGVAALAVAVALAELAAVAAGLALSGAPAGAGDLAAAAAGRALVASGLSAVLVALSAALPRAGDAALWGVLSMACLNAEWWLKPAEYPKTAALVDFVEQLIWPGVGVAPEFAPAALAAFAAVVLGALVAATAALDRKELTYAE